MSHIVSFRFVRTVGLVASLTAPCFGQVPRGHAVVSAFNGGSSSQGLWLVDTMGTTPPVPVTGLPIGLTWAGLAPTGGASGVLVDTRTGDVAVSEHAQGAVAGGSLDVHVITLNGAAVATLRSYPLGTVAANNVASTDQMAWVGADILVLNRTTAPYQLASGPLAGFLLGWVRPMVGPPGTPGTVVPVPTTGQPMGIVNAMAVDPISGDAFLGSFSTTGSHLYRVALSGPAAGVLVPLAAVPDTVLNLTFDVDGWLLVTTGFSATGSNCIYAIDPGSGALIAASGAGWPTTPFSVHEVNGLCIDPLSGDALFVDWTLRMAFRSPRVGSGSFGAPVAFASGLTDRPSGIAYRSPVTTYGAGSPATHSYEWRTTLLPGGGPTLGNPGFELVLQPNASTSLTALGASLGAPTPAPLATSLGFTLLLDPATAFVAAGYATPPAAIPLPIPAVPGLAGQDFFFQTFHLDPAGIAASNGLWLTPF